MPVQLEVLRFLPIDPLAAARATPTVSILVWSAALIVVAMLGGAIVLVVRGRMLGKRHEALDAGAMLEHLRQLRERGELSAAEFETAKASLGARLRGGALPGSSAERGASLAASATEGRPEVRLAQPGFDLTGERLPPRSAPPREGEKPAG